MPNKKDENKPNDEPQAFSIKQNLSGKPRFSQDAVSSLALGVDGALLASSSGDNTIKMWSLPDGMLLHTLQGHAGIRLIVP